MALDMVLVVREGRDNDPRSWRVVLAGVTCAGLLFVVTLPL